MTFDWERFLRARHIEYTHSGARQIVVHCPFCGDADHGQHMSINLDGRGWRCFRAASTHYGRAPMGLVQKLVGCSLDEAREIIGVAQPTQAVPEPDALVGKLARLRGRVLPPTRPRTLVLPREFRPLVVGDAASEPFVTYMEQRGYRRTAISWLAEVYDLHWATRGRYAWRVIFPVRGRRGELLTWTGRGIGRDPQPRYRQPPAGEVIVEAPRTLFGLNKLWSAPDPRVLVVCEGPLDATRVSVSGAALGVWGTCLFGLSMSDEQRELLIALSDRFAQVAIMLDATAKRECRLTARRLAPWPTLTVRLPEGVKDPGELTAAQATSLCLGLVS